MQELFTVYFLPCLWAFVACIGFGLVFNIQGHGLLICGLGGAGGWLVYLLAERLLGAGDIECAFLAALSIGAYSEGMARLRRCPVTSYCVEGETERFLNALLHTFGVAAALSVGAMLVSSVLRALLPRRR